MVGKDPERPDPPASATGMGGSIIPAQPLRRALLDNMQKTTTSASSSAGRGQGRTKKAGRGGRGSRRGRKVVMPSSPPPSADSPDHRTTTSDVDPSRTPVHEPPVADPSPHQTRVTDPSRHVSPVLESSSQKTPVTGSSSQKTPVTGSSSHETPEASAPEDGSEDTFSDDSYSDDDLVEKGKKVYKHGCTKLPPIPMTPDQRWLIAPKGAGYTPVVSAGPTRSLVCFAGNSSLGGSRCPVRVRFHS
ncbi:hypothetical protein ACQJBY_046404 [Aegilops geniculata]